VEDKDISKKSAVSQLRYLDSFIKKMLIPSWEYVLSIAHAISTILHFWLDSIIPISHSMTIIHLFSHAHCFPQGNFCLINTKSNITAHIAYATG